MGASEAPVRTHELDASFMYAAGQGSAIAIRFSLTQTPGSLVHVMACRALEHEAGRGVGRKEGECSCATHAVVLFGRSIEMSQVGM